MLISSCCSEVEVHNAITEFLENKNNGSNQVYGIQLKQLIEVKV